MSGGVVRLSGMPVRNWMRLQEHTDALLREYRLMVQQDTSQVPRELLGLLREVEAIFPESAVPGLRSAVKAAFDAGETRADVEATVTARQSEMLTSLHDLLSRVDVYCREGLLLTLPLDQEVADLRGWVVQEVARQLDGAEPRVYEEPVSP